MRHYLFKVFSVFVVLVGVLNYFANEFDWYWRIKAFDSAMHFLGGGLVVSFFIWIYFYSGKFIPKSNDFKHFVLVSLLGLVFVSVSWEIYEIILGEADLYKDIYFFDTTLDFIMDTLGGLLVCFFVYIKEIQYSENKNE